MPDMYSDKPVMLYDGLHQRGRDYPELVLLLIVPILVVWILEFSLLSLSFLGIVGGFSLFIFIYSYFRKPTVWTDLLVMLLLGISIGFFQFSMIPNFCFGLLLCFRFILTNPLYRAKWLVLMVAVIILMIFINNAFVIPSVDDELLSYSMLILTVLLAIGQFWRLYAFAIQQEEHSDILRERMNTMVSVINKLTHFIPLQVWQPIVKTNNTVNVVNKRAKLTVMFSDIAGFTELSDTLSADNLADILNTYMERMTIIANRHGAVLDKFIGDGMVCFFGEPVSKGVREDALACVAMAIDMRREMRSLRHQWRLMGFEGLHIRIGITTGYCHVGNFGSKSRVSYTLIGREANLASRLESVAGKGEILISQATYDYICHNYECELAGNYRLKGFDMPIQGWRVFDPNENSKNISSWVDYDLPGFNLHLNFRDIRNYDYRVIKEHLEEALKRMDNEEKNNLME